MCQCGCMHENWEGECHYRRCPWQAGSYEAGEQMKKFLADMGAAIDCAIRKMDRAEFAALAEGLWGLDALPAALGLDADTEDLRWSAGPPFDSAQEALDFMAEAEEEAKALLDFLKENAGADWKDGSLRNPLRRLCLHSAALADWHKGELEDRLEDIEGWQRI